MCAVRRRRAHATEAGHTRVVRAHAGASARVRASERAAGTRGWNARSARKGNAAGSSTWLARERAVLGSGAPRPRERPRERAREREERERIRSFIRVVSTRQDRKVAEEGIDWPLFLSLSPSISIRPRSMGYAAERRSKIDSTRVVTSPYAAAEYEVTHARSSTIR